MYAQLTAASYRLTLGSAVRVRYLQLASAARRAGLEGEVSIGEREIGAGGEGERGDVAGVGVVAASW